MSPFDKLEQDLVRTKEKLQQAYTRVKQPTSIVKNTYTLLSQKLDMLSMLNVSIFTKPSIIDENDGRMVRYNSNGLERVQKQSLRLVHEVYVFTDFLNSFTQH